MIDRRFRESIHFQPRTGSPMEFRDRLRIFQLQVTAQKVGKQVMVAVPVAVIVQRHQEKIGPFQALQHPLGDRGLRDGLAQRRVEAVENRCMEQELLHGWRLLPQDFFGQIIEQVTMAALELLNERRCIGATLQREGGDLQSRDPTFGAGFQCGSLVCGNAKPHDIVQKRGRLFCREAQIGSGQLSQLSAHTQPGQRQWGIGAAGHNQMQRCRQMIQEESERLVDRLLVNQVVIVENKGDGR